MCAAVSAFQWTSQLSPPQSSCYAQHAPHHDPVCLHLSPSGWYQATYHSLEVCWSVWPLLGQPGTRAHCGEPPSYIQGMTSMSALEPALRVRAHNTAALRFAHSSQPLRLLVTQNLYTKDINLNHFLWVNHFNLEPDSTDVCKMALLDAIYFCIGGNNMDWSHKKNYKT